MANDDKTTGLQAVIEDLAREFNDKINDDDIPPEMFSTAFVAMRTLYRCLQRCQRELEKEQEAHDDVLKRVLDVLDSMFQDAHDRCPEDWRTSDKRDDLIEFGRMQAYSNAFNAVHDMLLITKKAKWRKGEADE